MRYYEVRIRKYLRERGWDGLRPGDVAKSICIEAAELLELFQWDNPELADATKDRKRLRSVRAELADVLICCLELSVLLDLDTRRLFLAKLNKIRRKYPARLMRKSRRSSGAGDPYWRIKHTHRKSRMAS